jgi:heat shock protein HspQ
LQTDQWCNYVIFAKLPAAIEKDIIMTLLAKFRIGQIVRHRIFPFRGVIFDVDPVFNNTEQWYQSIPAEIRPRKDQPFYHLLAENEESYYEAYVSEQNLLPDESGEPVEHPQVTAMFGQLHNDRYELLKRHGH